MVSAGATRATDLATTIAFQSIASYPLDVVANAHTVIGQAAVTVPIAAALALVLRRRLGGYVWLAPLFILGTGALEVIFKTAIAHPAPPHEYVRAFGNPLGIPADLRPPNAFPSGHVARVTFLTIVGCAIVGRAAAVVAGVGLVVASVFLRVYLGDHWLSDALAGLALGGALGTVAVWWMGATARR